MKHVIVQLRMLPTQAGGRHDPIAGGYRPTFFFRPTGGTEGEVELLDQPLLYPGEEGRARVTLLDADRLGDLAPGTSFFVNEGPRKVAEGKVLSSR